MLAQDFRRALDLRSTWFTIRVLELERPARGRSRRFGGRSCCGASCAASATCGSSSRSPAARGSRFSESVRRRTAASRSQWSRGGRRATGSSAPSARARSSPSSADRSLTRTYTTLTSRSLRWSDASHRPVRRRRHRIAPRLRGPADASPYARYGIQDDAWLRFGDGTLDERVDTLDELGVDLVRFTINWNEVEAKRGERDWSSADPVLNALRAHGIRAVVTLYGTPRWANGGRSAELGADLRLDASRRSRQPRRNATSGSRTG